VCSNRPFDDAVYLNSFFAFSYGTFRISRRLA
jgi:hypothetical protein